MRALDALAGMVARGSLESPSTPLTGGRLLSAISGPDELWSAASVGDPMKIATVLRCVQVLADTAAGCPLRITDRATAQEVKIPVLAAERVGTTPFELWGTTVAHRALWGNAFLRKVRGPDGRLIVALVPIHPSRVVIKIEDGSAVGMPYVKRFEIDGGKANLTEHDVMHIPRLSMDGIEGVSVIGELRRTFGMATAAERTAEKLFDHGLLQTGFISTGASMDDEKVDILRRRWRARYGGLDNAYEVGVLDGGAKFEQLSMNPVDAQFLETRRFNDTTLTRIFGVPGWMVNDQEKSTSWGAGMEQQFIAFVTVTLKSYLQGAEQRIVREICDPTKEKAEFKVEGILRGDSRTRAAFYGSGIQHGWLVPNEVRALEDLPPVEWGDQPYRPYNASAADLADPASQGGPNDQSAA